MKKILLTIAVFVGLTAGALMLSAFASPKENEKAECSQTQMTDDWKQFRENVPYCDADKGTCKGYGSVWVNTDTYQVAFKTCSSCKKRDLSEYTGKDGYNMRFWHDGDGCYYYVNIYIPAEAFR